MFGVLEELEGVCRKAATTDFAVGTGRELMDAVKQLAAARAAFEATELHVLAALDASGATEIQAQVKTAAWVAWETRTDRQAVTARLRVANRLRWPLTDVDAALAQGEISLEHATVLAKAAGNPRVTESVVDLQGELVAQAARNPFGAWRTDVANVVNLLDQDGGFDPDRALRRNTVTATSPEPGALSLTAHFEGELAETVGQALEAATDRHYRRAVRDHQTTTDLPVPPRPTLHALALVDLVRAGHHAHPGSDGPVIDVTLVVEATDPDQVISPDGVWLTPDAIHHLLSAAMFAPLIVTDTGDPLAMGRAIRATNRPQRRALAYRDGSCVFPGCSAPASWCDAHHVTHWDHHGHTDIDNLAGYQYDLSLSLPGGIA